ncbi:efflux RND transporter periplasmic adaptor subunit [Seongchinamella sediminis]|uniref:efflux RND transporter periplasmic adaptor subunit n=1 Tax=Seongchinamella sediminis TaxID=2283635 RepID=UPI0013C305F4|nr:efflux RND transporter periplasmic adaptor subunit [Seongchinamella sediminis]
MQSIALAVLLSLALPSAAAEAPTPVKVLRFAPASADEVPRFPGKVAAGDSALLAFRVGGQIADLQVRMGDRVQQGALLAALDPTDYQLQLDAREAEYQLAKLEAERADTLYQQRLISEDAYDTARAALATSEARLEQAREQLSFCQLRAPFAGAIAFTYAMPQEVVGPQQPILNLQDISTLEVRFNLPPRYQPLLHTGQAAKFSVSFELMPGLVVAARYKESDRQPDPDTNSYPVTLAIASPGQLSARPGMPVTVSLYHPSLMSSAWRLPAEAFIVRREGGGSVWRIDPDTMTVQRTELVLSADGALIAGLARGDLVIAAGVDRLREGQRVQRWVREEGL